MTGTVQTPLTDGEKREFYVSVQQMLPIDEIFQKPAHVRFLLGKKSEIRNRLRLGLLNEDLCVAMELELKLNSWQKLFDAEGIICDTSKVIIPEQQPGFDRLIIIPKGLTMNKVIEILCTKRKIWLLPTDLDKAITKNDRSNKKAAYAIWVRDAEEEYKNVYTKQIAEQEINGITVLERLLYELMYFTETGRPHGVEYRILCMGSRRADGGVPDFYWGGHNGREIRVRWHRPDKVRGSYTREVVY